VRRHEKPLQGLQEVMNEMVVMSRLQHKSSWTSRLLNTRDEKMSDYEYMPNKKLRCISLAFTALCCLHHFFILHYYGRFSSFVCNMLSTTSCLIIVDLARYTWL